LFFLLLLSSLLVVACRCLYRCGWLFTALDQLGGRTASQARSRSRRYGIGIQSDTHVIDLRTSLRTSHPVTGCEAVFEHLGPESPRRYRLQPLVLAGDDVNRTGQKTKDERRRRAWSRPASSRRCTRSARSEGPRRRTNCDYDDDDNNSNNNNHGDDGTCSAPQRNPPESHATVTCRCCCAVGHGTVTPPLSRPVSRSSHGRPAFPPGFWPDRLARPPSSESKLPPTDLYCQQLPAIVV
jgi:hypothetical protein